MEDVTLVPNHVPDVELKPTHVDGYKNIAKLMDRSVRSVRNYVKRRSDPLPIYKVGGIVRLDIADYELWLKRAREGREIDGCVIRDAFAAGALWQKSVGTPQPTAMIEHVARRYAEQMKAKCDE